MISELCNQAGIDKKKLDYIAYGVGPGSFVGVRLSAAVAQAASLACKAPVIGFSSMQAMAINLLTQVDSPLITIMLDARMGDVYWGQYQGSESGCLVKQEKCISINEAKALAASCELGYVACQQSLDLFENKSGELIPDTEYLFSLIKHKIDSGINMEESFPVYLQGTKQWRKLK